MAASSPAYYVTFQLLEPATVLDTKTKGAMLPQSLTCPICSARYTRPTHLHKHIRSHSYQHIHQCICETQFTRRDVLKRHLKTCKGPLNQTPRKRRACEACVLSRTKCDRQLEQPCSRCVARGSKCVFIGEQPRWHPRGGATDTSKGSPALLSSCTSPSPPSSLSPTNTASEDETPYSPPTPLDWGIVDEVSQTVSPQIEEGPNQRAWDGTLNILYPVDHWLDPHVPSNDELDFSWFNSNDNKVPSYDYAQYPSPVMGTLASTSEDQEYMRCFFFDFCQHFPLVHPATWSTDNKPFVLIRAMQACGALFVKTRQATAFIEETLSSRNLFVQEFASKPAIDQDFLILAVVLLQTVGLFHQNAEQQVTTSVYHQMLVMMIRQTSLVTRLRSWMVPDLNATFSLEQSWREWAMHETMKRALVFSYFHDCSYPVYFSRPASFKSTESDVDLPSDDELWNASNPIQWLGLVGRPSSFSTGSTTLSGVSLHQALAALAGGSEPLLSHHVGHIFTPTPTPPNPFSHFILIHAILRDIYSFPSANKDYIRLQSVLYNWLQTWMHCCDVVGPAYNKSSLVYNTLQFYWLAQISLYAIEKGGSGWMEESARTGHRFALLKEWLERIHFFLRHDHEIPARLWGEQMILGSTIRAFQAIEFDDTVGSKVEQSNGLFSSFFDVH